MDDSIYKSKRPIEPACGVRLGTVEGDRYMTELRKARAWAERMGLTQVSRDFSALIAGYKGMAGGAW